MADMSVHLSLEDLVEESRKEFEIETALHEIHEQLKYGQSIVFDDLECDEMTDFEEMTQSTDVALALPEKFTDVREHALRMPAIKRSKIEDFSAGESIFDDSKYGCAFTAAITPSECGASKESNSSVDKLLKMYTHDILLNLLTSDVILFAFDDISCKSEVQKWLFFVMSIHHGLVESTKCADMLIHVMQRQMEDVIVGRRQHTFLPSMSDILCVFTNWGVDYDSLVKLIGCEDHDMSISQLCAADYASPSVPHSQVLASQEFSVVPACRNFKMVLKVLSCWLQARPVYTSFDITLLLLVICKVSLDPCLNSHMLLVDLRLCIASILDVFVDDQWDVSVPGLCKMLSELTEKGGNQVCILHLFSSDTLRCHHLQTRLAYMLLHLVETGIPASSDQVENFTLGDVPDLIDRMKQTVTLVDPCQISNAVSFLDHTVGLAASQMFDISELRHLYNMKEMLKLVVSKIRDSIFHLDFTLVILFIDYKF